jgi:hypothetical protein
VDKGESEMSKLSAHIIVILTAPLFLIWGFAIAGSEAFIFVGCLPKDIVLQVTLTWLAIDLIPPCVYYFARHPIKKAYRIVIDYWQNWSAIQDQKWSDN